MHISVFTIFIHLWIILYFSHITKCANYTTKGLDNTTDAAVIDLEGNGHLKPVKYNLEKWLAKQTRNVKKVQSVTIIPILALIVFLWIICFRACKWLRQDSKYKDRGCSYDVTSYVIVKEEDKDFDTVDLSSSAFVYDTVTSKFSLQDMLDYKMYDTVTSRASILKQNTSKQIRRSPTPDGMKQEQQKAVIQKKGRFSVAPVIDNYVRLKKINSKRNIPVEAVKNRRREIDLSASLPGNSFRLNRKPPPKRSTSDSRLSEHTNEKGKKNDVGLQVKLERIKERKSLSASIDCNTSESEHSIQNSTKIGPSIRSSGVQQGETNCKKLNHSSVEIENRIDTKVEIHSEDNSSMTRFSNSEERVNGYDPVTCLNGHVTDCDVSDQYSAMHEPLRDVCVIDFNSKVHDSSCVSSTTSQNRHSETEIPNNHRNLLSTSESKFLPNSLPNVSVCSNNNIPQYQKQDSVLPADSSKSGHSQNIGNETVHSVNELHVNGANISITSHNRSNHVIH